MAHHVDFTLGGLLSGAALQSMKAKRSREGAMLFAFGALFVVGGVYINRGNDVLGHKISVAAAGASAGYLASNAFKTKRVIPGVLAVATAAAATYHVWKLNDLKKMGHDIF